MAHQAKAVTDIRTVACLTPKHAPNSARPTDVRTLQKQFALLTQSLSDYEASQLLHYFDVILEERTPAFLRAFQPRESDHSEWYPAIKVKKGGAR